MCPARSHAGLRSIHNQYARRAPLDYAHAHHQLRCILHTPRYLESHQHRVKSLSLDYFEGNPTHQLDFLCAAIEVMYGRSTAAPQARTMSTANLFRLCHATEHRPAAATPQAPA
jgi:hypothetical protein